MEAEASAGSSAPAGSTSGELLSRLMDSVDDLSSFTAPPKAEADAEAEPSSSRLRASPLSLFAALVARLNPILRALLLQQQEPPPPDAAGPPPDKTTALESLGTSLRRARSIAERSVCAPSSSVASRLLEGAARAIGGGVRVLAGAWADAPAETRSEVESLLGDMLDMRFQRPAEEIKGSGAAVEVEDLVVRIKNGDEDELWVVMFEIEVLIGEGFVEEEGRELISVLLNRVATTKSENRSRMLLVLRGLASISTENKERMASIEALSTLVRSLSRDAVESREAVGLLLDLASIPKVRQRIGRVQGCMVMLVTLRNGEDAVASDYAGKLLCVLSANAHNVLLMAEAGYFIPLVHYLKEGSEMNKILMANVVSRMKLTDQIKSTLGEEGCVEPLVRMFTTGKLEAKLSALGALRNLSGSAENIPRLIDAGAVEPLLQLLFSVTSVLMTLREPAAAILASIAQSDLILMKKGVALQMLSLLNHSSPSIQIHLLQALNSIACHGNAGRTRTRMRENGAVQLLLPFLTESNAQIRVISLNLLFHLSKDFDPEGECFQQLGETHLKILVSIILASASEEEKAAAVGILSNLPVGDKRVTEVLAGENLLPVLISLLGAAMEGPSEPTRVWLLESIAGVMVRFTVPSDKKLQRASVSHGVISCLLKLLLHGPAAAKGKAALALAQLSQSTPTLSSAKPGRWLCVPPSSEALCDVHGGACGVRSTFCLVKAGALPPLVRVLEGKEREADEAVLGALATVLEDEIWEKGADAVERAAGVPAMVRILEVGGLRAQQKAIWMLERVFRLHSHRERYGEAAQLVLIDLTQKGDPTLRPMIAKVLAHLQLLQMQSSYF